MIPIENRIFDLVPGLTEKYPDISRYVFNTTRVDDLYKQYLAYVVNKNPPKDFKFAREGIQLEALLEEVLVALDVKYRYTLFKVTVANTSREFKKFEILRGREVEVEGDIALNNLEIFVVKKYHQLLVSAVTRGLPFNLTLADVRALIKRKTCFYTKVPFNNANENTRRTIDRLDCNLGYVKGNVVACTHEANQLKEHFFEHTGFDPEMVNKIFYAYFTLIAKGKIKPRKI